MKNKHSNSDWRRTDTFFFGSMITMLLFTLIVVHFDIKWFENTPLKDTWISMVWLIILFSWIVPIRFFPKTKWAKWWNSGHSKKR
jgi:membrane protein YdbS with pleckstrin-like domain